MATTNQSKDETSLHGAAAAGREQEKSFPGDREPLDLGVIRDYRLIKRLGEGGMGTVYKALHTRLGKIVALKVMSRELMRSPEAIARFEREMRAVGQLEHPNIVRAGDAGEHEGLHFLAMEYISGVDLSQLIAYHGPLAIADACELVRQAALGLQEAHEHGMVHRDIKPSNVMLTEVRRRGAAEGIGVVKILDLGLALVDAAGGVALPGLTMTGQLMGTLDYMAPEQADDTRSVDIRADIYSLGATLYKLLCGMAPFADKGNSSIAKKLLALARDRPVSIGERHGMLPDALSSLVDRMLAKSPLGRPASPQEVADALAPFAEGHNIVALLAGLVDPVGAGDDAPTRPADAIELNTLATVNPAREEPATAISPPAPPAAARVEAAPPPADEDDDLPFDIASTYGKINEADWARRPAPPPRAAPAPTAPTAKPARPAVATTSDAPPSRRAAAATSSASQVPAVKSRRSSRRVLALVIAAAGAAAVVAFFGVVFAVYRHVTIPAGDQEGGGTGVADGGAAERRAVGGAAPPAVDYVLEFDGRDDIVEIPSLSYDGRHPLTLEVTVTPLAEGSGTVFSMSRDRSLLLVRQVDGGFELRVEMAAPSRSHRLHAPGAVQIGRRLRLAAVMDNDELRLFLDGKLVDHKAFSLREAEGAEFAFYLGASAHGVPYFHGRLDEVRVSRFARYQDDYVPTERLDPDDGTLALYHCDDGRGAMLRDAAPGGRDGRVYGAVWVEADAAEQ